MICPRCHAENPDTSRFCGSCAAEMGTGPEGCGPTETLETPIQGVAKGSLVAGKYRILEEIGRGGMGVVFKAEDMRLQRSAALKFLPHQWTADPAARERFIHEPRAASALDHPNICNIHEIEETDDGRMYIAMACYEGESLRQKIERGPLKADEALGIAVQVAHGMAKAHEKGIVHRDLKPANILITKEGVAKILDFGLAKLAGQVKLTREGTTVGTVAYMSPEQARGESVDQRTDIWSLGIVLYEMLSGRLPFKGGLEQGLIHSILRSEPEPITRLRKDLPKGLEQIVLNTLSKNPGSRYESMDALRADLNAVAEGLKPLRAKSARFRGRILGVRKIYAYPGFAAVIVLAVLALLFLSPGRSQVYDSLAVLPLVSLPASPGPVDLTETRTAELIEQFWTFDKFRVCTTRQVMACRDTKKGYRGIGRESNVKALLDPALKISEIGDRITVILVAAATETPIFNRSYPVNADAIQSLYAKIGTDIIQACDLPAASDAQRPLNAARDTDRRAYAAFVNAKSILNTLVVDPSREHWESAEKLLRQAIGIDPGFARAYWALVGHSTWGWSLGFMSWDEAVSRADAFLNTGLSLDSDSAEAHLAAGALMGLTWDREGRKRELQRAVKLAPGNSEALVQLSGSMMAWGESDAAISEFKKATDLDPTIDPDNVLLGTYYLNPRRYDEAESVLAECYSVLDEKEEAFRWLERACRERNFFVIWIKIDQALDNIRSDPRFEEYLRMAGFEK